MFILPISTIIPTYNRAGMVALAVSSVLEQCLPGDEVIVIDDGSTDSTDQALSAFCDKIKYIRISHSGAGIARNTGIKIARNDLIAFLDSDDQWMPGKLAIQRDFMQKRPDILFCFSDFGVKNAAGEEKHHYLAKWHNDKRSWEKILGPGGRFSTLAELPHGIPDFNFYVGNLYTCELSANYIFAGTLMVRRQEAGEALHFGEALATYEDWECFGRLARKGYAAYFDCETAWQISHGGYRLTQADTLTSAEARLTLIKRVWGADPDFLKLRGDLYKETVDQQRLLKVRGLLVHGETKEAREELKELDSAPITYKLMASLPSPLANGIVRLKRMIS